MTSNALSDPGPAGAWLYCVCVDIEDAVLDRALRGTAGVAGETPRALAAAGLTAIVGSVDLARFGEEGLRSSLNDLDRLEAIARAHHGVVHRVSELGPVAPTRLATVYDDDNGVTAMLRQHGHALATALANVNGRQEWGVKAFATTIQPPAAEDVTHDSRPETGTAYLRRRQESLSASQIAGAAALAAAEALHVRLSAAAAEAQRHRPQDPHLRGDDRRMVLNAAYLLGEGHAQEFSSLVATAALDHPELSVAVTGPWPPYSFAVMQDERAGLGER